MLEAGRCRSVAEITEVEKIDRSFVSRLLLRLTLLAPDIQKAILEGRQSCGRCLASETKSGSGRFQHG